MLNGRRGPRGGGKRLHVEASWPRVLLFFTVSSRRSPREGQTEREKGHTLGKKKLRSCPFHVLVVYIIHTASLSDTLYYSHFPGENAAGAKKSLYEGVLRVVADCIGRVGPLLSLSLSLSRNDRWARLVPAPFPRCTRRPTIEAGAF